MEHKETKEFQESLRALIKKYGSITVYDLSKILILKNRNADIPAIGSKITLPSDVTHAEVMRTNVRVGWHLKRMKGLKKSLPEESFIPTRLKYFWSLK